ncbi:hypothetical protein NMK71_01970 [Weeksellaceae bacterium KMM 9713]|uniref:Uncharacterized protein n=1 Tax=Profundicola chukchiensis TaxID=2961959 RepID=A0A9X4MYI4_9FLAO|nr:hypothetical protein [Profundicola chukchiensis]MDG4945167.1 hypothetical protein [Profundicola chukchiensis]
MSRDIDIKSIRNRPRFKIKTRLGKDEFTDRLRKQFQIQNKVLGGYVGQEFSVFRMRKDKNEYWAPQLQVRSEVDEDNPNITIIRGVFGPRPSVWTLFMFLYILGGTIFFFFGLIWFVQMRLDVESWMVHLAWLGLFIMIATYIAAHIGQIIAKEHMKVLRDFMEKVVNDELETEFDE